MVCRNYAALTLRPTPSRVTNARVLVVSKVEKSAAVISVQKDALVDHSLNNVCIKSKAQIKAMITTSRVR